MNEITSKDQIAYLNKLNRKKTTIITCQWLILITFVILWEFSTDVHWIDPFIFSSPTRVLRSFIDMSLDGSLFHHTFITVYETFLGFFLGSSLGLLVAIVLWWSDSINKILEPYIVVLNSLPKTALAPILIVWLGNNMKSIIVTSILISIFITILTISNGFLSIENDKIKLIYSLGGNKFDALMKVVVPGNIPTIISALKVNIGLSLVGVIIGEFLVAQAGLGYLIVYGSQIFKLDWVMLSIIMLGILSSLLYKSIQLLEKKLLKRYKA